MKNLRFKAGFSYTEIDPIRLDKAQDNNQERKAVKLHFLQVTYLLHLFIEKLVLFMRLFLWKRWLFVACVSEMARSACRIQQSGYDSKQLIHLTH